MKKSVQMKKSGQMQKSGQTKASGQMQKSGQTKASGQVQISGQMRQSGQMQESAFLPSRPSEQGGKIQKSGKMPSRPSEQGGKIQKSGQMEKSGKMPSRPSKQGGQIQKSSQDRLRQGRFSDDLDAIMAGINVSVGVDHRLASVDIRASIAHCQMLVLQKIITKEDGALIEKGLLEINDELAANTLIWDPIHEDVHMNIEARLAERIGHTAGRLHTARSRNDQVATDTRLWLRGHSHLIDQALADMLTILLDQAELSTDALMPGLTHLQPAQPITFAHHLLAYVEMFGRDRQRLKDSFKRLNECPLGAAALAGTSFPIDRDWTAHKLGFDRPMANSLDAVSARDFIAEFLAIAALSATHLSRLSEEIILWSTPAYNFIRLSDAWSTGSSIMPQKRNPDAAELIRGRAGSMIGDLVSLLTLLKGLPLAYAKDLQEDKPPMFRAADSWLLCLRAMAGMVRDLSINRTAMHQATDRGHLSATDIADNLVRHHNMAFRQAHNIVGALVRLAEEKKVDIANLSLEDMQSVCADIDVTIAGDLSAKAMVERRGSFGGPAPKVVQAAIKTARQKWLS